MASSPSMFGDGPAAKADSLSEDYIQPTPGHGLRIWWAFYWVNTIFSILEVGAVAAVVQWIFLRGLISERQQAFVLQFAPYIVQYVTAIFVMRYTLQRSFRDFRIRLLSSQPENSTELNFTRKRTLRIWWTFAWRTLVYRIVLSFAANVPMAFISGAIVVISPAFAPIVPFVVNIALDAAVGLFVIYSNILDEEFGQFKVALAPKRATAPVPSIEPVAPTT